MTDSHRVRFLLLVGAAAVMVAVLTLGVTTPVPGMEGGRVWALAFVGFPVAAVILLWHRPGNVIGRLLGLAGLAGAGTFFSTWLAVTFADHPASALGEALITGALATVLISAVIAILLLFPTGRPLPGWERAFTAFLFLALTWIVVSSTRAGPMPVTGRDSPLGVHALSGVLSVLEFIPLAFVLLAAWTLFLRHRRGGTLERAQLRWLFSAALLLLAAVVAAGLTPQGASPPVQVLFGAVLVAGFWSVPSAIVVAISRYHLYEIGRLWSRTASYTIVASVLALVYAGSIIGLQTVLPGGSDLAIAASTLAAAALFSPLRTRVRTRVDRWFDRSRYEADRVRAEFAASLRDQLDLEAITTALVEASVHTMRPHHAQVWLARR
jgi:hypothetical protein